MWGAVRVRVANARAGARGMAAAAARAGGWLADEPEYAFLKQLGLEARNCGVFDGAAWRASGEWTESVSPASGRVIAAVQTASAADYERGALAATEAWRAWAALPAPARGEVVRDVGLALRDRLEPLSKLVALEMGKILTEARGEVLEYVHVCEMAAGLSRTLAGQVLPSERPGHALFEMWNPLGPVGVVTAFNFPVAVYGWNSAIAMVCGDTVMWKPSETTPLCGVAVTRLVQGVLQRHGAPAGVATLLAGGAGVGRALAADPRVKLLSFTGSTEVGRQVGVAVQQRFGRHLLELGGNNAIVVDASADLDLLVSSALFACAGTAGQRCTTARRLIVHHEVYDEVLARLKRAYAGLAARVGDPLDERTLVGPLHTERAVAAFRAALAEARAAGGTVESGGQVLARAGYFVQPAIVSGLLHDAPLVLRETFAPIVYVLRAPDLDTAVRYNNEAAQGLSSSLFTASIPNLFKWVGPLGSDCGIVNVNIPTNGAEVGGAFGGDKETGGGRESGSDAWKNYMRRSTVTVNHSGALVLAQNIDFQA